MAKYIESKRDTELFVAGSLEELLPEDSIARTIGAGLGPLDFGAYDGLYENDEEGRPAVNPRGLTEATDRLTVTEPDAGLKRQNDGSFAPGYNAQPAPEWW